MSKKSGDTVTELNAVLERVVKFAGNSGQEQQFKVVEFASKLAAVEALFEEQKVSESGASISAELACAQESLIPELAELLVYILQAVPDQKKNCLNMLESLTSGLAKSSFVSRAEWRSSLPAKIGLTTV